MTIEQQLHKHNYFTHNNTIFTPQQNILHYHKTAQGIEITTRVPKHMHRQAEVYGRRLFLQTDNTEIHETILFEHIRQHTLIKQLNELDSTITELQLIHQKRTVNHISNYQ